MYPHAAGSPPLFPLPVIGGAPPVIVAGPMHTPKATGLVTQMMNQAQALMESAQQIMGTASGSARPFNAFEQHSNLPPAMFPPLAPLPPPPPPAVRPPACAHPLPRPPPPKVLAPDPRNAPKYAQRASPYPPPVQQYKPPAKLPNPWRAWDHKEWEDHLKWWKDEQKDKWFVMDKSKVDPYDPIHAPLQQLDPASDSILGEFGKSVKSTPKGVPNIDGFGIQDAELDAQYHQQVIPSVKQLDDVYTKQYVKLCTHLQELMRRAQREPMYSIEDNFKLAVAFMSLAQWDADQV